LKYGRIAGGILCLTVLGTAACSSGSSSNVTVATAVSGTIATDAGGVGTVSSGVDVPVALSFTDHVQDVSVGLGQQVKEGQPLLTIDPQPLLANVSHLQSSLLHAESDVARVQSDLANGRTPPALVPARQDQEQILRSQVNLYRQLLAQTRGQSNTLTSPINGEVLAVNVQAGQVARPGATLVEIVDYHQITVTAELPVSSQPYVRPGDQAQLTVAGVPGVTLTGIVSGVSPGSVNYGTSFQLDINARNTADLSVHPGYSAYVRVPYRGQEGAIVRRMAVLNMDMSPSMFVVRDGVAQQVQVQVGAEDGPDIQIVRGIQPGDKYVLVGNQNLASGDHVHIAGNLGPLGGKSG
jgi:membrane fusion protein, multidrug efflux system